jgi:hypothetical protein
VTAKQALLGCLLFACAAVVASLAFARPPQAVEHAPTVEQCQADLKAWWGKAGKDHGLDDIPYDILGSMSSEMTSCIFVEKANRSHPESGPDYYELTVELEKQQAERLTRFLIRHELWQKFSEEDAAGKR